MKFIKVLPLMCSLSTLGTPCFATQYNCTADGQTAFGVKATQIHAVVTLDEPQGTFSYSVTEEAIPPFQYEPRTYKTPGLLKYSKVYDPKTGKLDHYSSNPGISETNLGTDYQLYLSDDEKTISAGMDYCEDDGERGPMIGCGSSDWHSLTCTH